jgi:transcription termination/antitermination protein NusA
MRIGITEEMIEEVARLRGLEPSSVSGAIARALVAAYKRRPGAPEEARVMLDPVSGDLRIFGQDIDDDGNVLDEWEDTDISPEEFGRIAAQTFKQVINQGIREAVRDQVFELYEGREGDLITGIVQQADNRRTILDLGDAEAVMPGSERIPFERLERGNRIKALILEVRNEGKGPQIVVSRSHPDFVRRLLELEVPELEDGTIEIKAIAREPGHRTKLAVASNDSNVDAKGACVGARGSRVRQLVNELRGEKVDVVQWSDDPARLIAEALGPAKVIEVRIDEEEHQAKVIVAEHQLSLAIGKEGQNARLAARLSGYRVDIRSDIEDRGEPVVPPVAIAAEPAPEVAAEPDVDPTSEETHDELAAGPDAEPSSEVAAEPDTEADTEVDDEPSAEGTPDEPSSEPDTEADTEVDDEPTHEETHDEPSSEPAAEAAAEATSDSTPEETHDEPTPEADTEPVADGATPDK